MRWWRWGYVRIQNVVSGMFSVIWGVRGHKVGVALPAVLPNGSREEMHMFLW